MRVIPTIVIVEVCLFRLESMQGGLLRQSSKNRFVVNLLGLYDISFLHPYVCVWSDRN